MNIKKIFALLMAGLLVCSLAACKKDNVIEEDTNNKNAADDEMVYENFTYAINGEGTYEITGVIYNGVTPIDIEIPAKILDRDVTGIAADAFKASKTIKSVTFESVEDEESGKMVTNIQYIGESAFYDCDAITSIVIPESVTKIGVGAFRGCDKLVSVKLPAELKAIDNYTFMDCKALTGVVLPEGLESIGAAAFWGCDSIKEITVPTSVKDMGDAAFYFCKTLNKVTVLGEALGKAETIGEGEDVEIVEHTIGEIVFKSCADDLVVTVTEGTEFAKYAKENKYNVVINVVAE